MTEDIRDTLRRLRMDLTNAQAKLTDAMNALEHVDLPERQPVKACPECGLGGQAHLDGCTLAPPPAPAVDHGYAPRTIPADLAETVGLNAK